MKSAQECRNKAAEAEHIADDERQHEVARSAHRSLARSWSHLATQKEWLDTRRSLEELRKPEEPDSG
jgi:hypothetical protein